MSIVDGAWSEPHGVSVVTAAAPVELPEDSLAAGTAPLRTAGETGPGGAQRFLDIPIVRTRTGSLQACAASRSVPGPDATSIVMPLPRPPVNEASAPRAVRITSARAARKRHQKTAARRRGYIVLFAAPFVGVALGFLVLALLSKEPARRTAALPPAPQPAVEEAAPAKPAAAPKAAAKAVAAKRAPASAPKAVAPKAVAPKAVAPKAVAPKAVAAKAVTPEPAAPPASKRAAASEPKPAATASKPAKKVATAPPAAAKPAAAKPAAKPPQKLAKATKKPGPAKPAGR